MRYFKDENGGVYSFADSATDATVSAFADKIGVTLTEITAEEYDEVTNPFDLDALKETQYATIRSGCSSAIIDDFTSDATGTKLKYCMKLQDQVNLAADIYSGNSMPMYTRVIGDTYGDDDWDSTDHTLAQLEALRNDHTTWRQKCQNKKIALFSEIAAISLDDYDSDDDCQAAVEAIVWVDPVATDDEVISLSSSAVEIDAGDSGTVSVTIPDNSSPTIAAATSDSSIVTASVSDGVVTYTGVAAGSATITVTATFTDGVTSSAGLSVTVS